MWKVLLNKVFKVREKVALNLKVEDEEKPFLDHLEDLRKMFVRIGVTLVLSVLVAFGFNKTLTEIVLRPYGKGFEAAERSINAEIQRNIDKQRAREQAAEPKPGETPGASADPTAATGTAAGAEKADEVQWFTWNWPSTRQVQEGFMVTINVSLVAAVILSFPLLVFFVLQFILPGLRGNERKILWPALGIGFGLFLTGVAFSYFTVLPRALQFFAEWNWDHGFKNEWMLGDYTVFATRFILIFGISFELPVVVMALVKLDFLSHKIMSSTRRHAIVAIAIFSAVITPTQDVLTLLLLAGPLYFLYEVCIWLAWFLEKKEREMYPEFYAERDRDEAELEKEVDEWDKEGYTPWFAEEEDQEIEDEYQQRAKASAKTAAESGSEPSADSPAQNEDPPANSNPETASKPDPEPTLEELARRDEAAGGTGANPADDRSRNED